MTMAVKEKSAIKPEKKKHSHKDDLSHLARAIISNTGVGIYIVQHGKFVYVSPLYQKLTGYKDTELIGTYSLNNIYPDDREMVSEEAIKCLKEKRFEPYEFRFVKKNDEIMWVLETITPVMYKGERATLGSFMDVTERKQMEEALRQSEERYRTILDEMDNGYYEVDLAGDYTFINDVNSRQLGYSKEEMLGMNFRAAIVQEDIEVVYNAFKNIYISDKPQRGISYRAKRKDGTVAFAEISGFPLKNKKGETIGFRGTALNVTERKRVEEALRQSEEKYRTILESIHESYFEVDLAGNFTFVNDSMCRLTGCSKEELLGMNHKQFTNEETAKEVFQAFNKVYITGEPSKAFDWQVIRKDGVELFIETSITLKKDSSGEPTGFKGMIRDITERKRMEQQLNYMATHDTLTGLPNRLMFSQLLSQAIRSAQRNEKQLAVFFIDLDRFKTINDSLGHEAGDRLLKELARRFKRSLRAVDVVARLGGDEFVIFIEEVEKFRQVEVVAHKILSTAIQPIVLLGEECRVTASIGISAYPRDGEDEQTLIKNADMAMYFAKEEGKNNYQFYSKDIQSLSNERLSLETNMRLALERKEFFLHYQAKVDFKTGAITGVEALLRWQNPSLGSVTPTQFIPVAEDIGLIVPIGRWVMKTACAQNVAWQRQGLPPVCMAVNLSLRQLMDDKLLEDIKAALDDSGMAPNLLELEITESMLMHDPARLIAILTDIKKMGVRLAIDNFGTGYASLTQLRNFPIDTLKMDRSFIRNLPQDSENQAITKAIIAIGKALSLTVIAEGVETQAQENFLRDHICDEMQGFYFSKPVAPDQFGDLLRNHAPSSKRN
jgi:diguanylate cyclase (GGDEF)-like protein/PAS domain S-box-containing protein